MVSFDIYIPERDLVKSRQHNGEQSLNSNSGEFHSLSSEFYSLVFVIVG